MTPSYRVDYIFSLEKYSIDVFNDFSECIFCVFYKTENEVSAFIEGWEEEKNGI
jgi:hypothetical protein